MPGVDEKEPTRPRAHKFIALRFFLQLGRVQGERFDLE
jgi:hypothetical protein